MPSYGGLLMSIGPYEIISHQYTQIITCSYNPENKLECFPERSNSA
jgi:hypothetical protein